MGIKARTHTHTKFWSQTQKRTAYLKEAGVDQRTILKRISDKQTEGCELDSMSTFCRVPAAVRYAG